jgi:uncharacterized membrane protein
MVTTEVGMYRTVYFYTKHLIIYMFVYVYDIPNYQVLVGSVLLYCVLWTIVCPLVLLPFVIVLSLFLGQSRDTGNIGHIRHMDNLETLETLGTSDIARRQTNKVPFSDKTPNVLHII